MDIDEIIKAFSGALLVWTFLREDGTPATFIHRCFRREVWRESGIWGRLGLSGALLFWPLIILALMGLFTWRNGPAIKRRTGKGIIRQMREQVSLATTRSVLPPWYYIFELYDDARRRNAGQYLNRLETKRGIYNFLRKYNGGLPCPTFRTTDCLSNKVLFSARCRDHGLPVLPVLMLLDRGRITRLDGGGPGLPKTDLFVKPLRGAGGRGAARWTYAGRGCYRGKAGQVLTEAELLDHLKILSLRKSYIVQPRAVNHPDIADLSSGTLTTVRVMTCRDERGEYEVTDATFRMAQGQDTVVDNFHAGGIAAKVDIQTGVLGRAIDGAMGTTPGRGWCETHPDTGAQILGRRLPCWDALLDLVRRAHRVAFSDQVVIGWDVAMLTDGPRLVEANKNPDLDTVQRPLGAPVGNARLGELLSFNLKRTLDTKYAQPGAEAQPRA